MNILTHDTNMHQIPHGWPVGYNTHGLHDACMPYVMVNVSVELESTNYRCEVEPQGRRRVPRLKLDGSMVSFHTWGRAESFHFAGII